MSGTKNTDNKLRQIENQSLPDMSRQDEHWQDMKKMLQQPGITTQTSKPGSNGKLWQWVIAACFIGGISFLVFKQQNNTITQPKPAIVTATDSPGIKTGPAEVKPPVIEEKIVKESRIEKNNDRKVRMNSSKKLIVRPYKGDKEIAVQVLPADTITIPNQAEPKITLAEFFTQLKKPTQEFIIDNKRDTVIRGKDGTALLIPANTFNTNEKIVITLSEYYSYKDIISNKLSTTSDGNQLITGGMIHLTAAINGKDVNIQPQKSIRWFIPDTTTAMKDMQLFNGIQFSSSSLDGNRDVDKASPDIISNNQINWMPQQRSFTTTYLYTSVKVLDLRDEPYSTRDTRNGVIGKFHIASKSRISKEEMEIILKEKYKYYKVKITKRKHRENVIDRFFAGKRNRITYGSGDLPLGDSAWMDIKTASRYKLVATDTIVSKTPVTTKYDFYLFGSDNYTQNINAQVIFSNANLKSLSNRYSVDINKLGWINCDRFYYDNRPKIQYYVDLKDTASNYYTFLVFDKIKSMMTGFVSGNKVVFQNVPKGETAKVICLGIQNGKTVSAMETVLLSKDVLTGLKFEETTPSQFKEQAAALDK